MKQFRTVCLLLSVSFAVAPAMAVSAFTDVPDDHWAAQAVNTLASLGILVGYPSTEQMARHLPGPATHPNTVKGPAFHGLIVPGKSLGLVAIGENADRVYRTLGKATGGDAAMGHYWDYWHSKNSRYLLAVYSCMTYLSDTRSVAQVRQILATSPVFRTRERLGVGNSLKQIRKTFPRTIRVCSLTPAQNGVAGALYDDPQAGIAFMLAQHPTAPGGAQCVGVIIHPPGHKVQDEYMPLEDEINLSAATKPLGRHGSPAG